MGRVVVEIDLANYEDIMMAQKGSLHPDNIRSLRMLGIVDTGAARLVLPETVVKQLGFAAAGESQVRYADHRTATRPRVKDVWLKLHGREGTFTAIVEPDRTNALIGAIVLEELDFVVDCSTQTVHPRDPDHIISEIE
jgi:predicted aspartyl protease